MAAKPDGLFMDNYGIGYTRIIKAAREMGVKAHIHHLFFSMSTPKRPECRFGNYRRHGILSINNPMSHGSTSFLRIPRKV